MAKATITFTKEEFMKPCKDGIMYSEECWEAFTQTMKDKFMNREISELTFFGDPESIKFSIEVPDKIVVDRVGGYEWFY